MLRGFVEDEAHGAAMGGVFHQQNDRLPKVLLGGVKEEGGGE